MGVTGGYFCLPSVGMGCLSPRQNVGRAMLPVIEQAGCHSVAETPLAMRPTSQSKSRCLHQCQRNHEDSWEMKRNESSDTRQDQPNCEQEHPRATSRANRHLYLWYAWTCRFGGSALPRFAPDIERH